LVSKQKTAATIKSQTGVSNKSQAKKKKELRKCFPNPRPIVLIHVWVQEGSTLRGF
jgi:hypothetical protein